MKDSSKILEAVLDMSLLEMQRVTKAKIELLRLIYSPIDKAKVRPLKSEEIKDITKVEFASKQFDNLWYTAVVFHSDKHPTVSFPCDPDVIRAFGKLNNTPWESYDLTEATIPIDKIGIYMMSEPLTMHVGGFKVVLL